MKIRLSSFICWLKIIPKTASAAATAAVGNFWKHLLLEPLSLLLAVCVQMVSNTGGDRREGRDTTYILYSPANIPSPHAKALDHPWRNGRRDGQSDEDKALVYTIRNRQLRPYTGLPVRPTLLLLLSAHAFCLLLPPARGPVDVVNHPVLVESNLLGPQRLHEQEAEGEVQNTQAEIDANDRVPVLLAQ